MQVVASFENDRIPSYSLSKMTMCGIYTYLPGYQTNKNKSFMKVAIDLYFCLLIWYIIFAITL